MRLKTFQDEKIRLYVPHLLAQLQAVGHLAVVDAAGPRMDVEQVGDARAQSAASVALHRADAVVLQKFL